jgi:hypothetical protein
MGLMVAESEKSKHDMLRAMRKHIRENGITDFTDFQDWCDENNDRWSQALDSGLRRLSRNTSTGVFIREEVEPVDGFTSEKGIGT